jgi:hypothetical protein
MVNDMGIRNFVYVVAATEHYFRGSQYINSVRKHPENYGSAPDASIRNGIRAMSGFMSQGLPPYILISSNIKDILLLIMPFKWRPF